MYGKIDPGARNPYRVALKREKGISPGCKCGTSFLFLYENYLTQIRTLLYTQSLINYDQSVNQSFKQSINKSIKIECLTKNGMYSI